MAVAQPSNTSAAVDRGGAPEIFNLSVSPPSGLAAGDLWVISVVIDTSDHTTGSPTLIGIPSGWTAVSDEVGYGNVWPYGRSMWKIAGSSESAVDVPIGDNSITVYQTLARSKRYTGAHATAPIGNVVLGSLGQNVPSDGPISYTISAITVQNDSSGVDLITMFYKYGGDSSTTFSAPSESTLIGGVIINWCAYVNAWTARNTGTYTSTSFSLGSSSDSIGHVYGQAFEIIPAAGGSAFTPRSMLLGVG